MEICPNCGLPLSGTRRICPGCRQPRSSSVATDTIPLDFGAPPRAPVPEPPRLTQWSDALALRAARRWQDEARAKEQAQRPVRRRWLVIAGVAVVVLTAWLIVNTGGDEPSITASTPVDDLPWSVYRPADRTFAIDMPGTPERSTATKWNGLALARHELDLPGAVVTVSVLTPGGIQPPTRIASQRAQELGTRVVSQQDLRVAWGTALEASFSDGTTSGWIEVTESAGYTYVIDTRVHDNAARARELFDRLTTSFRPAAG